MQLFNPTTRTVGLMETKKTYFTDFQNHFHVFQSHVCSIAVSALLLQNQLETHGLVTFILCAPCSAL